MAAPDSLQNSITLVAYGSGFTLIVYIINLGLNYITNLWQSDRNRKKEYEKDLNRLRLDAAQKAHQYIFRLHRAHAEDPQGRRFRYMNKEARDWLDGQAIILGEEIYKAVYFYFNQVMVNNVVSEVAKSMKDAENKLRTVLKKPIKLP